MRSRSERHEYPDMLLTSGRKHIYYLRHELTPKSCKPRMLRRRGSSGRFECSRGPPGRLRPAPSVRTSVRIFTPTDRLARASPSMTAASPEHETLLREAASCGASDILITAGQPVLVTIGGILRPLPGRAVLGADDTRRLAESFLTPELAQRFVQELELDTRYSLGGVGNFRVNLFMQRGRWGAAIRV